MKDVFDAWRLRQPGELRRRDSAGNSISASASPSGDRRGRDLPPSIGTHLVHSTGMSASARTKVGAAPAAVRRQRRRAPCPDRRGLRRALAVSGRDGLGGDLKAERRSPAERLPWLLTNARAADYLRRWPMPSGFACSTSGTSARSRGRTSARAISSSTSSTARPPAGRRWAAARRGAGRRRLLRDQPIAGSHAGRRGFWRRVSRGRPPLRHAVAARDGAEEHRTGALADADALFRTRDEPGASTFF